MKPLLKLAVRPLAWLFHQPAIRYSHAFASIRWLTAYAPREAMVNTAMEYCADCRMEGDYLEFGVYQGATFSAAVHLAQMHGLGAMRFYAFDSFEGLPAPTGLDQEGFAQFRAGQYHCDIRRFTDALTKRKVDLSKVQTVAGWFDQVLNDETKKKLPVRKAAVIWVDCDLYESTVPVLDFIFDYVQQGTILIFDDWFCFKGSPDRGEQQAFREWLQRHPEIRASEYHKFGWHGASFILQTGNSGATSGPA